MTQEEKILVDKYLDCKKAEEEAKRNRTKALEELAAVAPHKVGEIVKWTECTRKNIGTAWNPEIVELPPVEKIAVVSRVSANVWAYGNHITLDYRYEFSPLKKDGCISKNGCYPRKGFVWTGEIYDLNKE